MEEVVYKVQSEHIETVQNGFRYKNRIVGSIDMMKLKYITLTRSTYKKC